MPEQVGFSDIRPTVIAVTAERGSAEQAETQDRSRSQRTHGKWHE
jgi:hypothetical protein